MQGGPLVHTIAAKATCFRIAMTEAFRDYQRQMRANADVLCETLVDGGLDVLTGGTDTHLLQLDLRATEWTGKAAEERLHEVKVTVNRNTVPFDERPPTVASGVRIGTPAATMRGFDEDDFREVGGDHRRGARATTPSSTGCARASDGAVREAAALPGLPRLHDLRVTLGVSGRQGSDPDMTETARRAHARHASARPAQALVPARPRRRRRSTSASSSRR